MRSCGQLRDASRTVVAHDRDGTTMKSRPGRQHATRISAARRQAHCSSGSRGECAALARFGLRQGARAPVDHLGNCREGPGHASLPGTDRNGRARGNECPARNRAADVALCPRLREKEMTPHSIEYGCSKGGSINAWTGARGHAAFRTRVPICRAVTPAFSWLGTCVATTSPVSGRRSPDGQSVAQQATEPG